MAELSAGDRSAVHADLMRELSALRMPCGSNKANLKAAADAIDTYLSNNAGAMNTAIPQPARGELSQQVKALILIAVVKKRYLAGV